MVKRLSDSRVARRPAPEGMWVNTARGRMYVTDVLDGYLPTSNLTEMRKEFSIGTEAMEAQTGLPAPYFLMLEAEAATMSAREVMDAMRCYQRVFIALAEGQHSTRSECGEREWLRRFFAGLPKRLEAGESRVDIFMQPIRRWVEGRSHE